MGYLQKGSNNLYWENLYHGDCSNFEMFCNWIKENKIVGKYESISSWMQVKKNGVRGIRDPRLYTDTNWPHKDHTTFWKKQNGSKIIICHAYNLSYEFEKNKKELDSWANERELEIVYHGKEKSWYYPNSTFMYEIRSYL